MPRLTADVLQQQYGEELARPPLSDAATPRMLMKAFLERIPPVVTTDGIRQFYWDNAHRTVYKGGLAAPHGIHRMQRIRWIQHATRDTASRRCQTCRTAWYPSNAEHQMDIARSTASRRWRTCRTARAQNNVRTGNSACLLYTSPSPRDA